MKRILAMMLVLVLALSLVACGSDPSKAIIGIWENGNYSCSFKGDGTGTVAMDKGTTASCTWTYDAEAGVFNINYGYGKGTATVSNQDGKIILTWMETNYTKVG